MAVSAFVAMSLSASTAMAASNEFCLTTSGKVTHIDLPFRAGYHYLCLDGRCEPATLKNKVWERQFGSVDPETLYTIKTQIDHTDGECGISAQVKPGECVASSCLPPDDIAPSVPTNLRGSEDNGVEITLRWDAATDNRVVKHYEILRDGELVGSSSDTEFVDAQLTPETTYEYSVKACDAEPNCSAASAEKAITTGIHIPDITPPTAPPFISGGPSYIEDGNGGYTLIVLLSWIPSSDEHGKVVAYEIVRNNEVIDTLPVERPFDSTRYTDTNVEYYTEYHYRIRAQDDSGNWSAYSPTFIARASAPIEN